MVWYVYGFMKAVLIVEQDAAVGRLFEAALQYAGYEVHLATNPHDGYDVLRRTSIGMVLADLNMDHGVGLEMVSVMREQFPSTKLVGISSTATEYDPLHAAPLLNTVEILPNPVGVQDVVGTVHRLLGDP